MHAFRRAVSLGCAALEMDVHQSRDGVLVVAHDETVNATTNGRGAIADLDWSDLVALDNAYWFVADHGEVSGHHESAYELRGRGPHDRAFGIARLDEVLDEFPNTLLNFDIKETSPTVPSYERALATTLRRYGRSTDVIVASFHDSALDEFRTFAPEIHTSVGPRDALAVGIAIDGGPEFERHESIVALQLPTHYGPVEILHEAFIRGAHDRSFAVHVWTIDTADEITKLLRHGIDGIISDRPGLAVDVATQFL